MHVYYTNGNWHLIETYQKYRSSRPDVLVYIAPMILFSPFVIMNLMRRRELCLVDYKGGKEDRRVDKVIRVSSFGAYLAYSRYYIELNFAASAWQKAAREDSFTPRRPTRRHLSSPSSQQTPH
jgi:hypothetical protein